MENTSTIFPKAETAKRDFIYENFCSKVKFVLKSGGGFF